MSKELIIVLSSHNKIIVKFDENDIPVDFELFQYDNKVDRQCDAYDFFHFPNHNDGVWEYVSGLGFTGYRYNATNYVVGATIQTYDSWSGRDGGEPGIFVIEPVSSYKITSKKLIEVETGY